MSVTLKPADIELIVVHGADTTATMNTTIADVRKWHTDPKPDGNGWTDVGYHYFIQRDGTLEIGRALHTRGAHAAGWNDVSWGICMAGGRGPNGESEDNYTPEEDETLRRLLWSLKAIAPQAAICGHRDLDSEHQAAKTCPCRDIRQWFVAHALEQ